MCVRFIHNVQLEHCRVHKMCVVKYLFDWDGFIEWSMSECSHVAVYKGQNCLEKLKMIKYTHGKENIFLLLWWRSFFKSFFFFSFIMANKFTE